MAIDKRWEAVQAPPTDRLKTIGFGALKGKSDISPQWRIKAMSETYGLCGIGWRYEIVQTDYRPGTDGKEMVFVTVHLFIKDGDAWSHPIPGIGGNMVIDKNKNGLVESDEALKMAVTDALGNAMKYIGVASQIYEGDFDGSKYRTPTPATSSDVYEDAVLVAESLADETKKASALVYLATNKNDPAKVLALLNKMKESAV
jgi:hypothetical protein